MTLEESRALIERYGDDRELRRRDLSAHEQQASLQREQRQSLENELAAIRSAPSESGSDLRNIISRMRREIQTLIEGRGVQFEFRRRLTILQAYEGKLAAIEELERLAHAERYAATSIAAIDGPSVDPEHQSAYQRLMQARIERGRDSVDATVLALRAIQGRSLAETFVPAVTVTPSPRQAEAQMFYYEANEELPAQGSSPNPVTTEELQRRFQMEMEAQWQRGNVGYPWAERPQTLPPAPVPQPPPNPLHSITPLPRKIVMDRS